MEFATEEKDTSAVVEKIFKTASSGFYRLDFRIKTLSHGVSNREVYEVEESGKVFFEHFSYFFNFMELASYGPSIPFFENPLSMRKRATLPKSTEAIP